jgi:hypothetical protein
MSKPATTKPFEHGAQDRTICFSFRLTPKEHTHLLAMAAARRMSAGEFGRSLLAAAYQAFKITSKETTQ